MSRTAVAPLTIEMVSLSSLHPDPVNPRRISDSELEALTRSIKEFGVVDPVIARRETRVVIGGHQRLLAARKLGLGTVPAILLDIDEDKARLLNVALNKISGEFDEELLAQLLAGLADSAEVDLTLSGFDDQEIDDLLLGLEVREKRDRPESLDLDAALRAAYENPRARPGDLFQLGRHRLLCGDATDEGDVARLLGGARADMAFTDPPYNVSLGDHGGQHRDTSRRRLKNDALSPQAWEAFCQSWAGNLLGSVDGALYICMSTKEWPTVSRILSEAGGHWSDTIIWEKDRFVLGRSDYQRAYEPIWYGWRDGTKRRFLGGRDQSDVWQIPRPEESPLHPTMKPLELIERAVQNSSRPGEIVLDLFLGSGSTLVACERTGRVCHGLEVDPHYASLAIARWEAFADAKAVKESDPH
ncbi:MAG: DNA modification methylase [Thermoleophilia bacterium]|nr:DNA modification methylase [Thermoleophilia bacterium]